MLTALALLVAAPMARADDAESWDDVPPTIQHTVVDWAYQDSGHDTVPYPDEAAQATDLGDSIEASGNGGADDSGVGSDESALLSAGGLLAPFEELGPVVWIATAGIVVATVVVGTAGHQRAKRYTAHVDATDTTGGWQYDVARWREAGYPIYGNVTSPGAFLFEGHHLPDNYYFDVVRWFDDPHCRFGGSPPPGARLAVNLVSGNQCYYPPTNEYYPANVDYPYMTVQDFISANSFHPYDSHTDANPPPSFSSPTPDPGVGPVDGAIRDAWPGNGPLIRAIKYKLGIYGACNPADSSQCNTPESQQGAAGEATVSDVAASIRAKNANAANMTDTQVSTVASACVWAVEKAQGDSDTCKTLPIFVSDGSTLDISANDQYSQSMHWDKWVMLSRGEAGKPTSWWSDAECNSTGTGKACHEFPFLSTDQGGGLATPRPIVRLLNFSANSSQGAKLSAFYGPFKCNLRSPSQRGTDTGDPFIYLPLPQIALPEYAFCNPPGTP